ncbi:glycosyltransferase family 2 protein [Rhizobium sp. BK376]|uniref:glycosyltransferase family 2 protein n=1 Tax=Rhizobium sp. BK376 TaxID=2512149 RepID=UPI0010E84203|nr:glycosyltransferase family 2 protein [Rhizobium sp. BK376]TCR66937.1 glycosyltransferase involved in cell wall biosynthesis [Rhizobium sp. BK376]
MTNQLDSSTAVSWKALSKELSIVIPAFNEENGVGSMLEELEQALPDAEIIIVDDGSSDGTCEKVSQFRSVTLIRHLFNRGYGAALKTGMRASSRPYIAWFDADGEMRVEDLAAMTERLIVSSLAAVIGSRSRRAVTHVRTVGKAVLRMTARMLGLRMGHDLNCGLRVFRRAAILPYLAILPDGYSASTTSTMIMAERGYTVEFHSVSMKPRIGQSKVRLVHGFNALIIILRTVMLFSPLRIFMGLGLPLLAGGFLYAAIILILVNKGVPALAVISVLAGLLLLCVGLLADQISQMRLSQLRRDIDVIASPLAEKET